MTKRILALLLALLLLPVAALAEATRIDVKIELDEVNAVDFIRNTGMFAGADNEDELCAAMVSFMDDSCFTMIVQDDAGFMEIILGGEKLLDFSVLMGGENLIITSDLMEGAGLSAPMALLSKDNDAFLQLMMNTDWEKLLSGMFDAAKQSLGSVQITETRGSFSGDAYTGGVYCTTITFDDRAIAILIDSLLTEDVRELVMAASAYWEIDGAALLADIDAANDKAAGENAHHYILRIVRDENRVIIGLSLSILRGGEQLGTLSIGFEENKLRIVAGFGLDEVNYWHAQEITFNTATGEDGTLTYSCTGTLEEFTAPKTGDFSFASVSSRQKMMNSDWTLTFTRQGSAVSWQYTVNQTMAGSSDVNTTEAQGIYFPGKRFFNKSSYSINGKSYMTETVTVAPCDPIPSDGAGLELYDLINGGEEVTDLAASVGMMLAQRLMKVIPMQLLMYMQ